MRRTLKNNGRSVASITALMVALALVVPLSGAAVAGHVTAVTVTPESDTAVVGTCNPYTVQVTPAQTTTVDVNISQASAPGTTGQTEAANIGFCEPVAADGPNPQNPNAGTTQATPGTGGNTTTVSGQQCAGTEPATGATTTTSCTAEFTTNQQGQVTFGVTSNQPGTMNITVFVEEPAGENDTQNVGEPADTATKTWIAGGQAAVTRLDCEPETDRNPEGTTHQFTCTAFTRNAQGQEFVVQGVTVSFDVIAGPNAEEVNQQNCAATNQQGQTTCQYTDTGTNTATSPPGTDRILAFVEQTGAPGPQGNEPQDEITKAWVGDARNVQCTPENDVNPPASVHTITCTVTDVNGNPVANQDVQFGEEGAGRFTGGGSTFLGRTNENGVVTAETTTNANETGTQTITATLGTVTGGVFTAFTTQAGTQECERAAGQTGSNLTPAPTTAGNCADTVTKTWTTDIPPTPPPGGFERNVTLEPSKRVKRFGKQFSLGGSVTTTDPNAPAECIANVQVILEREIVGTDTFVEVDRTTTDAGGLFGFERTADRSALYIARVEATGTQEGGTAPLCAPAASGPDEVLVKKAVRLRISDTNIRPGKRIRFNISFAPCEGHQGDPIYLLKAIEGVMGKIASKKGAATQDCQASFKRRVFKSSVFQGMSPKRDADHLAGKSRKKAVTVRRRG